MFRVAFCVAYRVVFCVAFCVAFRVVFCVAFRVAFRVVFHAENSAGFAAWLWYNAKDTVLAL